MKYRKLGKTDLIISEVGFGCIPIIRLEVNEAVDVLRHAFSKGINFFDTANAYHDSEMKIGKALKEHRKEIVLATKTGRRDGAGATKHLEKSLRLLQTDYIDLFQFHQVGKQEEWEAIFAPGGAMEAVLKAREQGKIRHIGITSHSYPLALQSIKAELFATIMFPFSFIEDSASGEMLSLAEEKEIGFLAMKIFGGGVIDNANLAFKFLRQHPAAIPIPGFDSLEYIDEVLAIYEQPNIVSEKDVELIETYRQDLGSGFCRRCEYCQPCAQGVIITPAMSYPVIVKRMSPSVSVQYFKNPMESVTRCTGCGECITRCPYELNIPDIIQRNYKIYNEHLKLI